MASPCFYESLALLRYHLNCILRWPTTTHAKHLCPCHWQTCRRFEKEASCLASLESRRQRRKAREGLTGRWSRLRERVVGSWWETPVKGPLRAGAKDGCKIRACQKDRVRWNRNQRISSESPSVVQRTRLGTHLLPLTAKAGSTQRRQQPEFRSSCPPTRIPPFAQPFPTLTLSLSLSLSC